MENTENSWLKLCTFSAGYREIRLSAPHHILFIKEITYTSLYIILSQYDAVVYNCLIYA